MHFWGVEKKMEAQAPTQPTQPAKPPKPPNPHNPQTQPPLPEDNTTLNIILGTLVVFALLAGLFWLINKWGQSGQPKNKSGGSKTQSKTGGIKYATYMGPPPLFSDVPSYAPPAYGQ